MICHLCNENKLSTEFPFEQLTDNCCHPLLHCLRCAVASVKDQGKCSQCDSKVGEDNEKYQDYVDTLEYLYPDIENDGDVVSSEVTTPDSKLFISRVSGESTTLSYNQDESILDLKKRIETELKIPSNKQLLLYQGRALKNTKEDLSIQTVKDCNVLPNSKLQLIIVLYPVQEGLDHVIFDFYWGFPDGQTRQSRGDFLDASVLLYDGSDYLDVVDFRHSRSTYSGSSVIHSGRADMGYEERLGHQKINVHIKSIPDKINHLVFTLSARSSDVSKYRNPSLRFYDERFPDKVLCTDEMRYVKYSQAIIMCSLSKTKGGHWAAKSVKRSSSGNTLNYAPLRTEIASLIRRGDI